MAYETSMGTRPPAMKLASETEATLTNRSPIQTRWFAGFWKECRILSRWEGGAPAEPLRSVVAAIGRLSRSFTLPSKRNQPDQAAPDRAPGPNKPHNCWKGTESPPTGTAGVLRASAPSREARSANVSREGAKEMAVGVRCALLDPPTCLAALVPA